MGVQACRLPGLKRLKGLRPLKLCKSFSDCPTAQAKATPRRHPWLLLAVQPAVRHALHASNPSNASTSAWHASSRSQQAPQGHINGFLWVSKPAVCQALNASKALKPLKACKTFSERPTARRYTLETFQTLKHLLGMPNPAANRHPKGHINGFLWASKPAVCQALHA